MRSVSQIIKGIAVAIVIVFMGSCEKDYYFETPPPKTSHQTANLEASRAATPPTSINSAFWRTADYLKVTSADVSLHQLYTDGLLNMTGIFNGLADFNNGADPGLSLKAAYDNDNLYILAEWTDSNVNVSNASWLWNGPTDARKTDSTGGWTSQRNSDHLAFAFEISPASNANGTFTNVGCAASCHGGANSYMHPDAGKIDLWNWDMATSAPLGYARDMVANSSSLADDSGQKTYQRNNIGTTDRSGPAFEWDGTSQNITLPSGQTSILDPGFFLMNKTPFLGDAGNGDAIYHRVAPPGDCVNCHGEHGEGGSEGAINTISQNKKSRATLISNMDDVADMTAYWGPLSANEKNDVIAYLKGLSGVPGNYLTTPDGSNADITAVNNVTAIQIKNAMLPATNQHTQYQVLFTRKLNTGNADDVQFDPTPGKSYRFGIAIMNNDGKNHIGSNAETLLFK